MPANAANNAMRASSSTSLFAAQSDWNSSAVMRVPEIPAVYDFAYESSWEPSLLGTNNAPDCPPEMVIWMSMPALMVRFLALWIRRDRDGTLDLIKNRTSHTLADRIGDARRDRDRGRSVSAVCRRR